MADLYEQTGDFRSALAYHKLYNALNDSLTGENVRLKIAELNAKYEPQSKEVELEKKRSELLINHIHI